MKQKNRQKTKDGKPRAGFISNHGFTLIEVMVAIFLMVTALLGLISTTGMVINGNTLSKMTTTATTLAQDKMEELKNIKYQNMPLVGSSDTVESIYTRTWTISPNTPAANMTTISVAVSWSWKGAPHNVTLNTIRAQ